ncbi:hypothetical protein [Agrococcus sp. Ld7]|uniref:hypothetical protein n=1 Tax=Agrococcus sp. Ld7 TaxID=649148 RepID=UPI00386791DE
MHTSDPSTDRTDDAEIERLLASMGRTAFLRRAVIRSAAGPPVDEQLHDGRTVPLHVAEHLDRFRDRVNPALRLDLHDIRMHSVVDGLDLTIGGLLQPEPPPEPRDLLHVYGPDRDTTGERQYYRFSWLDHSQYGSAFTTSGPAIIRSGRLAGACGVYWGQWAYSLGGAGMLFTAEFGPSRVFVRPHIPWLALTSFNHATIGATVRCSLGILVQSWKPGAADSAFQERDHWVDVVLRSSAEGYLFDSGTSGTAGVSSGVTCEFVAVPGRRYAIYVYAWLEVDGGRVGGEGPIGYSRIELDASVPFVVVEEVLL